MSLKTLERWLKTAACTLNALSLTRRTMLPSSYQNVDDLTVECSMILQGFYLSSSHLLVYSVSREDRSAEVVLEFVMDMLV